MMSKDRVELLQRIIYRTKRVTRKPLTRRFFYFFHQFFYWQRSKHRIEAHDQPSRGVDRRGVSRALWTL